MLGLFGIGSRKKSRKVSKKASKKASKKRRAPAKKIKRSKGKKVPFGGYAIDFAGRDETLEQIFGKKPIPPSQMTKKLWAFVKKKRLGKK